VKRIKDCGNKEFNFYANFQLTSRRNKILYQLRFLKRQGKIQKLFTGENGDIAFKRDDKGPKTKVTYCPRAKNTVPTTLTDAELDTYFK